MSRKKSPTTRLEPWWLIWPPMILLAGVVLGVFWGVVEDLPWLWRH